MRPKHARKWLNTDRTLGYGGYILWSVTPPQKGKGNDRYVDAHLKIADCSRVVSLAIDTSNEYIENTIEKLSILIEEIQRFKVALLAAKGITCDD